MSSTQEKLDLLKSGEKIGWREGFAFGVAVGSFSTWGIVILALICKAAFK